MYLKKIHIENYKAIGKLDIDLKPGVNLIIGDNGAGKTSIYKSIYYKENVAEKRINTDEMVARLGSWQDNNIQMKCARQAVKLIRTYIFEGISFNQETTLSGKSIISNIRLAKEKGFYITMNYIGVESVEIAKERVEQSGIIFIDEIDKIAVHGESHGQGVSREGVQRDILPIVEGSNVNTKYGVINTTHILFIAAGAFSVSAPSDLIPELQGRFPLRVELDSLHKEDFKKILQEPKNSLIGQYTALLSTEGVTLNFTEDAIDKMSFIAEDVNARAENIGARRLHTIMEKVLDEISYSADEHSGETINVDAKYVEERLNDIVQDQDLSRYIL